MVATTPPPAVASHFLLIFVDGVGLGAADPKNPLAGSSTPTLEALLGGPLTMERVQRSSELCMVALDACLGVAGLPQSATGQTALFTGVNGAEAMGRHVTAFPGPTLRAIITEHSLFVKAARRGLRSTFANAFSRRYFELVAARKLRYSVTVWAAMSAELRLRDLDDLRAGRALSWDIERDRLAQREQRDQLPPIASEEAGRQLAMLAAEHRLTVFETFLTDLAGHGRIDLSVEEALGRVDRLVAGVLGARRADVTVLLTSDHGNIEVADDPRHTRNPVPLLAVGPDAPRFGGLSSILDVTPAILDSLTGASV